MSKPSALLASAKWVRAAGIRSSETDGPGLLFLLQLLDRGLRALVPVDLHGQPVLLDGFRPLLRALVGLAEPVVSVRLLIRLEMRRCEVGLQLRLRLRHAVRLEQRE